MEGKINWNHVRKSTCPPCCRQAVPGTGGKLIPANYFSCLYLLAVISYATKTVGEQIMSAQLIGDNTSSSESPNFDIFCMKRRPDPADC